MREIRLYGSEGGEAFNPLSLPLSVAPGFVHIRQRSTTQATVFPMTAAKRPNDQ